MSSTQEIEQLKSFKFEVITVNERGSEIKREEGSAAFFTEDLDNDIILDLVAIPGGTFTMGAPFSERDSFCTEQPQHQVVVPSFYMSKFQITQAQWRQVASLPKVARHLELYPSYFEGDNLPVEQVSWYDAKEFCARLSRKTGLTYRLPSESQWEYASRAGSTSPFHFGPTITSDLANYWGTYTYGNTPFGVYRKKTTAVGCFKVANEFGLYDMHGNVWEWCEDDWHDNYQGAPVDGTAWLLEKSKIKVIRGGSWYLKPYYCRSAFRNYFYPAFFYKTIGFRVVSVLPGSTST